MTPNDKQQIRYDCVAGAWRHWQLSVEGRIATISMTVDPDGGLVDGYKLKLNSYDLGVDIELNDIVQRLRFDSAPDARTAYFERLDDLSQKGYLDATAD